MASKSGSGVTIIVAGEDKTGEVFNAVNRHLAETREKAKETNESLGEMGELLRHGLETAGIAIGAREIVSQFREMIASTMEAGVQLAHLGQQTGISIENLSVLKYAAQSTGVDFEVLTRGFKKLAVTAYEADTGNKDAAKGFKQLGISVADLRANGDDMYAVMTLVADKFKQMPDGISKSDTASKIFGARMGSEMIPVLNDLGGNLDAVKAEAESLGLVWDEAGIKKMEEMHKSVNKLKGAFAGLALEITSSLAHALTELSDTSSEFIKSVRLSPGATAKGIYGAALQAVFGNAGPGFQIQMDAAGELVALDKATHAGAPSDAGTKSKGPRIPPPDPDKEAKLAALRQRAADSRRQLADAAAHLEEVQLRSHVQTMMDINEEFHRMGLKSDQDYLAEKERYQAVSFDAEATEIAAKYAKLQAQENAISAKAPKSAKERLESQTKLNELKSKELELEGQLTEVQARRAKAAREMDEAWAHTRIDMDPNPTMPSLEAFKTPVPNVVLPRINDQTIREIQGASEKYAHAVFDPLFELSEKWDQKWKQMRQNLLRDLGQSLEGQLFGALFHDPNGRGGKGWSGMGGEGDSSVPGRHNGLSSTGLLGDLLGSVLSRHSSATSNGGLGSGAGTIPAPAAALAQIGKTAGGAAAGAGIQVILNNNGAALQVDQTQQQGDGGEGKVIQIMLKQLETNGSVAQGIRGLFQGL